MLKTKVALAGNRTPVSRVAGENSTTEPPTLVTSAIFPAQSHMKYCIHVKNKELHWQGIELLVSCVAGENSTTEPTMLVTSSIFPAQSHIKYCIHVKNKRLHWLGNRTPVFPRGRRGFYH